MLAGYVIGALMVMDGTITLGTYLAYVTILIWIIEPMRGLGRIIVQASTGLVSYERVAEIIRQDREPLTQGLLDLSQPLRGEVVFDDVSFAYTEGADVLNHISFRAKPGQSVA